MRRASVFAAVLALTGCEDYIWGEAVIDEPVQATGFAGVEQIVAENCLGCHSTAANLGGLDLEIDLHGATVNVVGQYSIPLVLPGQPEESMFYLKVVDEQPDYTGTDMPPGSGGLPRALAEVVYQWIESGAPDAKGAASTVDTGE